MRPFRGECRLRLNSLVLHRQLLRNSTASKKASPRPATPATGKPSAANPFDGKSVAEEIPQALREQTKYRVIRLLGRGGMGSVYEAYHERMDRQVAIKVINPALVDHPEAVKRFDQEVRAAAKLHHANVAMAYDADEFGPLHALVMEFVPGQSLDRFLAKNGALSVKQACDCLIQAAAGLQDAHKRGMVHRDLKPQNLMLTPEGKVKILDFGLAKLASERRAGEGLTRDNTLMGTAAYLAPEQALDAAKADIRADIYSLGCTLYCLLAGTPPFVDDTEMKVLMAHQRDTHRPLVEVRPDVPRELSDVIDRMLAKNPAERPQTPADVGLGALVPFLKVTAAAAHANRAVPPQRAPSSQVLGALVEVPFDDAPNKTRSPKASPLKPATAGKSRPSPIRALMQSIAKLPPAGRWSAIVGLVALALVCGAWGISLLFRTSTGTITIENVPNDATVSVDGNQVTLTRDGDEVTVAAGAAG